MPIYFSTPNYSVGLIPKCGCSTLSRAVIKSFQPETNSLLENAHYPEGRGPDNSQLQSFANIERGEPLKQSLIFVRDPVQRFASAMAQVFVFDVDSAIDSVVNGVEISAEGPSGRQVNLQKNLHFIPQILWCRADTKLYKFPDHLEEGAEEVGLQIPLPRINVARRTKPTFSQQQIEAINSYYSEDLALFNSITSPGIITGAISSNHTWPEVRRLLGNINQNFGV